ncbi:hypothetical protein GALMADRAFT_1268312 [Galerina marginata CBS 339.88]|uniref:Uncharacterized protein n=1 Tax=Galerina marginata (strain CBS 339.88) TaxID=685588 RepID=A0A067T8S6_GALM3|nr:hypothetical protein GALMADRAFT_1268312 [Galerina marginata CBS 339.88]
MSLSRKFILNYFSPHSSESLTNAIRYEVGESTSGSRESSPDPAPRAKDSTSSWVHLIDGLYKLATTLYTFGLHLLLYKQMAFRFGNLPRQEKVMSPCDRALEVMTGDFAGYDHWNANITQITRMWKIVRKGCAFIVPISLAFFQVSGVSNNIYARTTALSACLCSGAGLVASNWYLFMRPSLRTRRMRRKWIEASRSLKAANSADFWVIYSQPISSLAWSTVFCVITIFIAVWTNRSDAMLSTTSTSQLDWSVVTSAVFLTVLILAQAVQIYRGMRFFSQK